jgi:hypothetical protein
VAAVSVAQSAKALLVGEGNVLAPLFPNPLFPGDTEKVKGRYGMPGAKDTPRYLIYGGTLSGPVALSAMAGGGRVKRQEDLTLQLHVRVYRQNSNREEAEARAVAIGDVICDYIAANWTLGGALTALKKATVDSVELDGWTDDDGSGAVLTLAVGLMTYLT